jgi:hypothetical protein
MLALTYDSGDEKTSSHIHQFGLLFDGDYIDLYPLFKFCGTSNPAAFVKGSEYRSKYAATVQIDLGHDPAFRIETKPKRMFYHKMMVKMVLYTLEMLELEEPIASCWDMDELPMPDGYQFDFWDMRLTLYDQNGAPRKPSVVRVFQLRANKWINLTSCSIRYDGDDVTLKKPYDIAKCNITLLRQLWALDHTPAEVVAQDSQLNSKAQSADAKKVLASQFVDTSRCYGETWCHPVVFNDVMMSLSLDYRMKASELMLGESNASRREVLIPNIFRDTEYISSASVDSSGIVHQGDHVDARLVRVHVDTRKTVKEDVM